MSNAALLAQIQQGRKLKKVETHDRSAPAIQTKGARGPVGGGGGNSVGIGVGAGVGGGAPQLGGLFAGGVPKLKPAGGPPTNKPLSLGKAPIVPKRNVDTTGSSTDASSVHSTPPSKPPPRLPPSRAIPPPGPSAPAVPRRPPAVPSRPRSISPPPRPSTSAPSLPTRAVPPLHKFSPSVQLTAPSVPPRKPPPPPPSGRPAPPPPPPRPASVLKPTTSSGESPVRAAPPPPSRRLAAQTAADQPAQPPRVRALSVTPTPSRAPPISLPASRLSESNSSTIPPRGSAPTRRAVSATSPGSAFVNGSKPNSRIPSPPPSSGTHTFLTSADFPPPRNFTSTGKRYASGNVRGCTFDISLLA